MNCKYVALLSGEIARGEALTEALVVMAQEVESGQGGCGRETDPLLFSTFDLVRLECPSVQDLPGYGARRVVNVGMLRLTRRAAVDRRDAQHVEVHRDAARREARTGRYNERPRDAWGGWYVLNSPAAEANDSVKLC